MIRHYTSISNIEDGEVVDPTKVKHADVTALKLSNISSWVDPQTHLNLDFPKHLMREVYIADDLVIGGKILVEDERFKTAYVNPLWYRHLGLVDEAERADQLRDAAFKKV